MNALSPIIVVANTITLVVGTAIVFLAYRAYARTGSPALRALTVGLGLVTLGTLLGGSIHQLVGESLLLGVAVQSAFTAIGFVALAYSLYVGRGPTTETVSRSD